MFKKLALLFCTLALSATPALAMSHEGGGCGGEEGHEHMGPPPGLMIPLPPDTEMPPPPEPGDEPPAPEDMAAAFAAAIGALDSDGDGLLSKDELKAAHDAAHEMMGGGCGGGGGGCGDGGGEPPMGPPPFPHLVIPVADFDPEDPGAAFDAIDGDDDGKLSLEEIGAAFESFMDAHGPMDGGGCGGCGGEMGMDPEWPEAECNGATGNEITRELTGAAGANAVAISLPAGREASCFSIATDAAIEIQIIEESDPPSDPTPVMWHSDDGEEALGDLVLEEGIYHVEVEVISLDESAAITVTYVDYPAE